MPAVQPVADEVNEELKKYGSIGRGTSPKSNHSTEVYEKTKEKVIEFVGADPEKYTVFYVNNTTDGLNKLASAMIEDKSDLVLATRIEHHSNDLPWRELGTVIYAEVDYLLKVLPDAIKKAKNTESAKMGLAHPEV